MSRIKIMALIACTGAFVGCKGGEQLAIKQNTLTSCGRLLHSLPLSNQDVARISRNSVCVTSLRYGTFLLFNSGTQNAPLKVLAPRSKGLYDEFFDILKDQLIASDSVRQPFRVGTFTSKEKALLKALLQGPLSRTSHLAATHVGSALIAYSAVPQQPYDGGVVERKVLYSSTGWHTSNLYYNPQNQLLHAGPP
jgi:hypothetical protein